MANAVITVLEADGVTQTDVTVLDVGRQAAAASKSVAASTEDKAVLDAIAASLNTLDNVVAGSEAQVDIVAALPAGTNNIGDVDVLTVPTDPFGANADAASATGSISAKLRAIATALGATALDLGSGTGGSRTLRFFRDTAQWIGGSGSNGTAVQRVTVATDDALNTVLGAQADAASATTSIKAALRAIATALGTTALDLGVGTGGSRTLRVAIDSAQLDGSEYETVAASQTAQTLGATGGTGDYISKIVVIPATTSPGNILLLDNATSITVFAGGASSVSNLVPFVIDLGMFSVSGAWKITTGANVSAIGIGNFT